MARPGVARPGVARPGVARPGVPVPPVCRVQNVVVRSVSAATKTSAHAPPPTSSSSVPTAGSLDMTSAHYSICDLSSGPGGTVTRYRDHRGSHRLAFVEENKASLQAPQDGDVSQTIGGNVGIVGHNIICHFRM